MSDIRRKELGIFFTAFFLYGFCIRLLSVPLQAGLYEWDTYLVLDLI